MNRLMELVCDPYCLLGAAGLEHLVPVSLQKNSRELPQVWFVLGNQNRFHPTGNARSRQAACLAAAIGFGRRQINEDRSSTPRLAFDANPATTLLHDAVYRRESQTRSFAHGLGGEKRFECMSQRDRIHSVTGIANGEHHIKSWRQIEIA